MLAQGLHVVKLVKQSSHQNMMVILHAVLTLLLYAGAGDILTCAVC